MLRVLRNRDFGLLWLGQAVSLVGDGIYLVAIAWLVLDISNEPSALALVGLAWTLPMVAGGSSPCSSCSSRACAIPSRCRCRGAPSG